MSLFVYPLISQIYVKQEINQTIDNFDTVIDNVSDGSYNEARSSGKIDDDGYVVDDNNNRISIQPVVFEKDLKRLLQDSLNYNAQLKDSQNISNKTSFNAAVLNLDSYGLHDGMYCYLKIEAIDLKLPVYLGSSEQNMSYGAVHLANTSLPIGGESTNAVIAAHTGYIGKIFFDNLKKLSSGDKVTVVNYFDTIIYTVTDVKIIGSTYTSDIYIQKGKDMLTLITCANQGKERLEVICERT